jgi:hypothetical protein
MMMMPAVASTLAMVPGVIAPGALTAAAVVAKVGAQVAHVPGPSAVIMEQASHYSPSFLSTI